MASSTTWTARRFGSTWHECGPCLREYGLEEAVKRLVAKHCGCDPAPADLRAKILVRIREVRATIEFAE